MSEKTYVKHVKLDVVISVDRTSDTTIYGYDEHGEYRGFKREMLTPYEPEEVWEDAPGGAIDQGYESGLRVLTCSDGWHPVPSPYTRTITRDGKLVVQRRKS